MKLVLLTIVLASLLAFSNAEWWYPQDSDQQDNGGDQGDSGNQQDNGGDQGDGSSQQGDGTTGDQQQNDQNSNQQSGKNYGNQQDTSGFNCVITQDDREKILAKHNEIRNNYACGNEKFPVAACMYEMVWSDIDAKKAQDHANERKFAHDTAAERQTEVGKLTVNMGQNIGFAELAIHPDYAGTIEDMYKKENGKLPSDSTRSYQFGMDYGHASQITWGLSGFLGCGAQLVRKCRDVSPPRDICLVVCNYSPPGNYPDTPMYIESETGTPASNCVNGKSSTYSCLCKSADFLITLDQFNTCPKPNKNYQ